MMESNGTCTRCRATIDAGDALCGICDAKEHADSGGEEPRGTIETPDIELQIERLHFFMTCSPFEGIR